VKKIVSTFIAAALCAITACSNTCNGGGGGGATSYSYTNCPAKVVLAPSCVTCLETSCSSQLSAVNTACSPYFNCVCPNGVDAATCPKAPSAALAGGSPIDPCGAALFGVDARARGGLSDCAVKNCSKCAQN
jgi:hypothetical protein